MCDTLEEKEDCSICLYHINSDDLKQKTICHHTFHADCLSRWTRDNNSCPLCRTPFGSTIQTRQDVIDTSQHNLYVSLPFWFNEDIRMALPEAIIPFAETTVDINFAALSDLILEEDENQPSLYSFALEPEVYQPSGSSPVSRIDDTRLFMSGGVVGALPLYLTAPFNLFPESNEPSGSVNRARIIY